MGLYPRFLLIGETSPSLTMSAVSSSFWSALLHALREERPFALVEQVPYPNKARSQSVSSSELDPPHPSLRSHPAIMITTSDSSVKRSGTPHHYDGDLLHTMRMSRLSRLRTELLQLLVIPFSTPHPEQSHGQPPGHRHLGDLSSTSHGQMEVLAAPLGIDPCRHLRCFHQQETQ